MPIPASLVRAFGRVGAQTGRAASRLRSVTPGIYAGTRNRVSNVAEGLRNKWRNLGAAKPMTAEEVQAYRLARKQRAITRAQPVQAPKPGTATPPKVAPQYRTEFINPSPRVVFKRVEPKMPFFSLTGGARPSLALMGAGAGLGGYMGYQQGNERNRIGTGLLGALLGGLGSLAGYKALPWFLK